MTDPRAVTDPRDATEPTTDRVDALVADIEAIPATLARVGVPESAASVRAAFEAALAGRPAPRRILLVGHGSSLYAAMQAERALRRAGLDVDIQPGASDVLPVPAADRLCVAISNGGRTPEVVEAARRFRGREPVLAITRDPGSPLAAAADGVIVLPVAAEASGIATTSFAATLGLLLLLGPALGDVPAPDFGAAATAAERCLLGRAEWLPGALTVLAAAEEVAVLAPWSEQGIAAQAALLLREAPRRTADSHETVDWLHTGIYTALPGSAVLLFDGSPADDEVVRTIAVRGGRAVKVSALDSGGPAAATAVRGGRGDPTGDVRALSRIAGPALLAAELWRARTTPPPERDTVLAVPWEPDDRDRTSESPEER